MKYLPLLLILCCLSLANCIASRVANKVNDKIENFPFEMQAKEAGRKDRFGGLDENYHRHADLYTPATEEKFAKAYHDGYYFGRSAAKKVARAAVMHSL